MVRASTALLLCAAAVRAEPQPVAEAAPQLPSVLTLERAREIFRQRGFDLLVAEANVASAEGDLATAGALPNPGVSLSASKSFGCGGLQDCVTKSYGVGIADNALVSNLISGKRGLRKDFARAALEAARRSRDDAHRTLEFTLAQTFYQALLASAQRDVARENRDSFLRTRQLNEKRFELGAMNEADLATIQVAHLESEQALETAEQNLRAAKVALAFLLGFRRLVPDFGLDEKELEFSLPGPVATATRDSLLERALERRPDLAALTQQAHRAEAGLRLAKRNIFPDVGLSFAYATSSDLSATPQAGSIGISFNLPLLYFQRGEIRKAEADVVTQHILRHKIEAQVVLDVETAWAQLQASRNQVQRMQATLLERARKARDLVQVQYQKGAASLLDLLNAQRTYTATRGEYAQDLANYWIAVGLLEQATATRLKS
jgi:cobalt-zinc-cadmium efflux system outer membrane protein